MKQRRFIIALGLFLGMFSDVSISQEIPRRVVSMNVCTDQLALLLARPSQLYSVSWLAADPSISVLSREASELVLNHGLAEEVFLMKPDLIIAGSYTTRATVNLLKRLGFRVELFNPSHSFSDIRETILRMGALLGNTEQAEELIREFDENLTQLQKRPATNKIVGLYYANSYTSGIGTLADEVVGAAGLRNLGQEMGYSGTIKLPLELLVLAQPDMVAGQDNSYEATARAQAGFSHPAYKAVASQGRGMSIKNKYWVCGAPFTLDAAKQLADYAKGLPQAAIPSNELIPHGQEGQP